MIFLSPSTFLLSLAAVEIKYELYNPTLLEVDVLRLERRLDNNLWYLRDAPREYSFVPFDTSKIPHSPGDPIPLNDVKVRVEYRSSM